MFSRSKSVALMPQVEELSAFNLAASVSLMVGRTKRIYLGPQSVN
jgi:hypothetical protein